MYVHVDDVRWISERNCCDYTMKEGHNLHTTYVSQAGMTFDDCTPYIAYDCYLKLVFNSLDDKYETACTVNKYQAWCAITQV